jgi:deoxyribodipyrimidine photo-lyase
MSVRPPTNPPNCNCNLIAARWRGSKLNPLAKFALSARVTVRRAGPPDPDGTCVVYWMQRSQRPVDNPALDLAVELGKELKKPVVVFFAPVPFYPRANLRHYQFLVQGIPDIAEGLRKRNIGFVLRSYPEHRLPNFCEEVRPAIVVGDENPLREPSHWRELATAELRVPLWTVDADVIVPSKLLEKEQYAAHTIRPRLHAKLNEFLTRSRNPKAQIVWKPPKGLPSLPFDFDLTRGWRLDRSVSPVSSWQGGTNQGSKFLHHFVTRRLQQYAKERNHPELDSTSRLSPYLHFGHISPVTVALAVQNADAPKADREAFLNELVVWRELAINFAHFNKLYDSFECAEPWAHRTLAKHAKDPRPVLYTEKQLENAETHDPLWNAAQMQMVKTGWMHNYMRMYWAKKILEWSRSPASAFRAAVNLNDKYFLDGRDPNGYAGIAWAIAGKFDRPWFERPIFGLIRYMSLESTGRKFDSKKYIEQQTQPPTF